MCNLGSHVTNYALQRQSSIPFLGIISKSHQYPEPRIVQLPTKHVLSTAMESPRTRICIFTQGCVTQQLAGTNIA